MSQAPGILTIVVGLLVSVALHELGHMIPAKRFGVLVPEYSVGFGPALARRTWRGTTFVLRILLLGGYVRITGMFAPARPGTRVTRADGRLTLAEDARRMSAAEIPEGQEHRAFYRLSAPRKAVVMLGGPVVNLAISIALVAGVLLGIGLAQPSARLDAVQETVATESGQVAGPALDAGIRSGDRIVSWNGRPTPTWEDVRDAVAASDGSAVPVVVERGDARRTVTVAPVRTEDGSWVAGIQAGYDYVPATVGQTAATVWQLFAGTAAVVVQLPVAVWDVAVSLFTEAPRDPAGVISVVGVGQLAGDITSADGASGPGGTRQSVSALLWLLASLNMALFVFNLIPLPPLDGGHVAGAVVEGVRRTWARLRGAADPGPADTARLMPVTYTVGALLIALTVLLVAADIVDPVSFS